MKFCEFQNNTENEKLIVEMNLILGFDTIDYTFHM